MNADQIPMLGVKESLNVAVAFGIASYQLAERRRESGLATARAPDGPGNRSEHGG